jgi:hypothetical protein
MKALDFTVSGEPASCTMDFVITTGAKRSQRRGYMQKVHRSHPTVYDISEYSIAKPASTDCLSASLDGTAELRRDRPQALAEEAGGEIHRPGMVDTLRSGSDRQFLGSNASRQRCLSIAWLGRSSTDVMVRLVPSSNLLGGRHGLLGK